ncbi:MAG: YggS family pyridoxal phosphate-dependent enzyme [Spirochaetaceae bacterium]|jgi:pyridoxal phosphate enzyme (YggS family)|nr:YggS family pyridoxal phosphate-dependent enzyme [Spirochaetaceae bacterium]
MSIAENIARIEERIQKACAVSGRKRDEITLMGVTKFHSGEKVLEAWQAGIRCFGENRVQEAAEKFAGLRERLPGAELHLIGSLQRNKAKVASELFDCVQSVDRPSLILELGKRAAERLAERERPLPVLFELHTGEESKRGFAGIDELCKAAELALAFPALRVRGLMTMAPNTGDESLLRASFRQLVKAQQELRRRFPPQADGGWDWSCLSMGMSGDFEIAIEEGSTLPRIGGAIFGERL